MMFNQTSSSYYTYFLINIYWHFIQKLTKSIIDISSAYLSPMSVINLSYHIGTLCETLTRLPLLYIANLRSVYF